MRHSPKPVLTNPVFQSDWDPVASLVFCGPGKANYTIINGKVVVSEGQLTTIPMEKLIHEHSTLSHDLINQ